MPNWCYNRIRVDADSDQVEQLKEIHDIIEKFDDVTGEPNPKWNPDEMGWFIPYVEETHGT